jgi:hypothetical protein
VDPTLAFISWFDGLRGEGSASASATDSGAGSNA